MKTLLFFAFLFCYKLGTAQDILSFNDLDKTSIEITNTLNKVDSMFAFSNEEMSAKDLTELEAKMNVLKAAGILLMAGGGASMLLGGVLNIKGVPDEFHGIDVAFIVCGSVPFLVGAVCTILGVRSK
jgi:hypothetical protein